MLYEEYIKSKKWRDRRYAALERVGFRCEICGETESLEVHHKTYERLGNEDPADLIVICKGHHWIEHNHPKEVIHIDCSYARGLVRRIDKAKYVDAKGRSTQELINKLKRLEVELIRHRSKCKKCS